MIALKKECDNENLNDIIEPVQIINPVGVDGKVKKVKFIFDIDTLDLYCKFITSNSELISRASLVNVKTMMNIADTRNYERDDNMMARIDFIRLVAEARIDLGLSNPTLILQHARKHSGERKKIIDNDIITMLKDDLSSVDIDYINGMVADNLLDGYSIVYAEQIMKLLEKKSIGDYRKIRDFANDFKKLIQQIQAEIRQSEAYLNSNKSFDLDKGFENAIYDILGRLKSPTNKWKTGIKYLNRMLNGGFESGRVYVFMGITGVGKSIILLSVANWIRKFNKAVTKDPTKRPAVLYITQENSLDETVERLFNMTCTSDDIRDYTPEEVMQMMREKGGLNLNSSDSIDLIIKYYQNKEIGVDDIDAIINDIEEESGREVICLVHDYIARLKCSRPNAELRHELAANADDFHNLAIKRGIPVITASQLNRAASATVEAAAINNKRDATKLLGNQNVSESWGMIQNVDAVIIINREEDDTVKDEVKEYMVFKKGKLRGRPGRKKSDEVDYFVHPFDVDNGIILLDDEDKDTPLSKFTINDFINPIANDNFINSLNKNKPIAPKPTDELFSSTAQDMFGALTLFNPDDVFSDSSKFAEHMKAVSKIDKVFSKERNNDLDLMDRRRRELKDGFKNNKYKTRDENIIVSSRKTSCTTQEEKIRIASRKLA